MPRVLIIEDDEPMRTVLSRILAHAGYDVVAASDGESGLAQYRAAPADLVITDLFMPGKEGLETIQELRREFPQVSVIAMSGHLKMSSMLKVARGLGAIACIEKPFESETLLGMVQASLKESRR